MKKILSFEDDEMLRQMYTTTFEQAGFIVSAFEHPPRPEGKLIELVLKENPGLIITDLIMPVMDGFEEIKILKSNEKTKHFPIIGLDNMGQKEVAEQLLALGAVDYLIKADYTPSEVVAIIHEFFRDPKNYSPHQTAINVLPDSIQAIMDTILSSSRVMPAHFTSNGKRNQSFCVDFKELPADDEERMATSAYNVAYDYVKTIDADKSVKVILVKIGEDVMLASYILTKRGLQSFMPKLTPILIKENIDRLEGELSNGVQELVSTTEADAYLTYCIEYGEKVAHKIQ